MSSEGKPRARKLSKIERLSPELQTEIDERLFDKGWSAMKVAQWLKEERNVLGFSDDCVSKYFKLRHNVAQALHGGAYVEMMKGTTERIDALKELYKSAQ